MRRNEMTELRCPCGQLVGPWYDFEPRHTLADNTQDTRGTVMRSPHPHVDKRRKVRGRHPRCDYAFLIPDSAPGYRAQYARAISDTRTESHTWPEVWDRRKALAQALEHAERHRFWEMWL